MAGTAAAGGQPPRVSMQEHMAIDVSPGPIRPIRLISHYFPHFYPFFTLLRSLPCTLRTCAPQRRPPSTLHPSCSPTQSQKETQTTAASQLRTRTVQGTRVPVWEETLTYHGFTRQDAECKTLRLCVCEDPWLQRQRQAPSLGELRVPLRKLVPNRARSFDICLEKRRLEEVETEVAWEEHGRVLLSLCYSSQWAGLLEFFYSGPREELAQKTLLVSVWDYDLGTADDFIGGVQLGSHASGERLRHWLECLDHSDHRLELWHPLDSKPVQLSD
ncbi:double C2-like domain-containing protein gamma isoform X2 [Pan paniscus]|uniref:double C2-like domain-containing protein gamma isoform X2 n=1 Tax=Pan paniscus TaxID=9597 RepID=UPI0015613152|nr:double C2-like domain-containing protein gamma isoform X2 [Pan paniscus]